MTTVIKVENLSKRYRLGLKESRKDTLMGQIGQTLKAPIENFKRLRSMTRFEEEDESVFWALRDINFEVKQGEVLGIIGHNGAGKSTLLKLLSRITDPSSGRILINGRIASLLEIGTGFHQDLTGRENIYMNGTILGMTRKEIDRKLDEIVDFSGVEKHLDTPVKFYSSGMKVRLGFAVAAHLEPEILIIDEVLAVGDMEFQRKAIGRMKDISTNGGRTVLFVSHDMAAIRKLCSRAILLKEGNKIFEGSINDTINSYTQSRTVTDVEIGELPRKYNSGEGIFTEIRLFNSRNDYSKKFLYRENIEVRTKLKLIKACRVNLDLVVKTHDDLVVLHVSSALQEISYELTEGIHEICYTIDNQLVPGRYLVTIGAHHVTAGITIDYCENVYPFEVLSAGLDNNSAYTLGTKYGLVNPNVKIEVKSI